MVLFTKEFAIFCLLVISLYYSLFKGHQWVLLLAASLFFYRFFADSYFIFFSIVNIYFFSMVIDRQEDKGKRKFILVLCLLLNFGLLFSIKYTNFLSLRYGLLIPLGISFYMFQSISYLLDVYYKRIRPESNPFKLALFISYFPQIIQGPIGRFDRLMPDLKENKAYNPDDFRHGFLTACFGAFKKIFIADRLALLVGTVFSNHEAYSGSFIFFSVLAYGIQIYADFSGGIDIVRGISQMMSIKMDINFRRPFFASSVQDFWRRWHISLGAWMRDYVFYPLNLSRPMAFINNRTRKVFGNKKGKLITICISTYILYLVVGIWHGSGWHYILYGIWNGTIISISLYLESAYKKALNALKIDPKSSWFRLFQIIRTNILVTLGRYFTRSGSATLAFSMLKSSFTSFSLVGFRSNLYNMGYSNGDLLLIAFAIIVLFLVDYAFEKGINLYKSFDKARWPVQFCIIFIYLMLFFYFVVFSEGYVSEEFIYRMY